MDITHIDKAVYDFVSRSSIDLGYFHPYIVDFAIVVPILAMFFHFISLLTATNEGGGREFLKAANLLFFIAVIAILFAYITGVSQGSSINDTLTQDGREVFSAHAQLGRYLFIAFILLFFLKIISLFVKKEPLRYIFGGLFFIAVIVLLYQNVLGNYLVFDYGAGVVLSPY